MLWFNLSLASAVSKAANQAITKKLTRDFPVLVIAAFGQLAAGILLLPLILFPGLINIPADFSFHTAASITILLNIIAILLLIEAIRRSDLSYSLPFLGLTPVFTIFMGWILRGEVLSVTGVLGILLVVTGAFGIDTRSLKDWATLGGKRIFRDKGVRLVILVAVIYSVSSVYDKTATLLSDPFTFVWFSGIIRAFALMIIFYGRKLTSGVEQKRVKYPLQHTGHFLLLGMTFVAEALLILLIHSE